MKFRHLVQRKNGEPKEEILLYVDYYGCDSDKVSEICIPEGRDYEVQGVLRV